MTFISYAQNQEDVLLWRALGHVAGGFYIDVGANDPEDHSVTKAFYEAGWRGINIEPLPQLHRLLLEQRPRDLNLAVAAGSREDSLTMYDVPAVNGWASPDPLVAAAHRAHGFEVAELTVPMRTLSAICAEHVAGDIHFLKIDVEGFELDVLRGMDFQRWRPWVLVIEATMPNSRVTCHETWEPLVLAARYRFAWFDGLNRYYVAEEHAALLPALAVQPNVFDEYISHHLDKAWAATEAVTKKLRESEAHGTVLAVEAHDAHEQAELAEARAAQAEERKRQAEEAAAAAQASAQQAAGWARAMEQELVALKKSTSWRVTAPLRIGSDLARAVKSGALLRRIVKRLTASERLRRLIIPVLLRHPALGRRVAAKLAAIKQSSPAPAGAVQVPDELRGMPASVRAVLSDLLRARANQPG